MNKFSRGQLVVGDNPSYVYVVVDMDQGSLIVRPVTLHADTELIYNVSYHEVKPAKQKHLERIK